MSREVRLYSVSLRRLAKMKDGKYDWLKVSPICVWARNTREAVWHAILILSPDKHPIYNASDQPVAYELDQEDYISSGSGDNFYVFWAIGQHRHIVCPGKNLCRGKTRLKEKGIRTYEGFLVQVKLLKSCPGKTCPWFGDVCNVRQVLSEELCLSEGSVAKEVAENTNNKPPTYINCPKCGEENLDSRPDCYECGARLLWGPRRY